MSQLQRSPEPGAWFIFDHSKRIAIVRVVEVRQRRLLRSVTFHDDPAQRQLIGYFPEGRDAPRDRVRMDQFGANDDALPCHHGLLAALSGGGA